MNAAQLALVIASVSFFPFSRDAFELPHAWVLTAGALFASRSALPNSARHVLLLLAGACLVTTLSSSSVALSFPGAVMFAAALVFASVSSAVNWRAVVLASLPIGVWALVQATGRDVFLWQNVASWCGGMRPFATLGHPTQLGVFMAAVTVLSLELGRTRSKRYFVVTPFAALICLSTLSRAGWLTLVVGVVVYAAALGRQQTWRAVRIGTPVALVVVALGIGFIGLPRVLERMVNLLVAPTRLALWKTALLGFSERPLVGFGFDTFVLVDQQFRQPEAWKYEWGVTANHAHASLAQVLATQGLLGFVVVLAVIVVVARAWKREQAWRNAPAEVALVVSFAVASLVTFHDVLTSALWSVALVKSLRTPHDEPRSTWWRVGAAAVLFALTPMLAASVFAARDSYATASSLEPWNATWPALDGASLESAGAFEAAQRSYREAVRRVPLLAVSHANVGRAASFLNDRPTVSDSFEKARRLAPLDARMWLDAAESSARVGQLELAAGSLEGLVSTYPDDGPAWLAFGRVRVLQGRRLEARGMIEASLEADWRDWPEGPGAARQLLSALHAESGDLESALRVAAGPSFAEPPTDACGAPVRLR